MKEQQEISKFFLKIHNCNRNDLKSYCDIVNQARVKGNNELYKQTLGMILADFIFHDNYEFYGKFISIYRKDIDFDACYFSCAGADHKYGTTLLCLAAYLGNLPFVQDLVLLRHVDVNKPGTSGKTPIEFVILGDTHETDDHDKNGFQPHLVAQFLLKHNCKIPQNAFELLDRAQFHLNYYNLLTRCAGYHGDNVRNIINAHRKSNNKPNKNCCFYFNNLLHSFFTLPARTDGMKESEAMDDKQIIASLNKKFA